MSNFRQVTPFLYVQDMAEAERFFVELLGFQCWRNHMPSYGYFWREKVGFRVLRADKSECATVPPGNWSCYIDVEDVDAVVAELKPKLETWPHLRVHGPVNQTYGQREFMISLPDGHVLVFGMEIKSYLGMEIKSE